jgi:hypothetical protein
MERWNFILSKRFSFLSVNRHRKPFGEEIVIGVESGREKEDISMYEYWHLVVFVESRSFVSRSTKVPKIEDLSFDFTTGMPLHMIIDS